MEKVLDINVFEQLGETLNTREAATTLFVCVVENYAQNVVFDFSQVEFMSRSFADQFHKERMKIKEEQGLKIDIKDASESVRKMLLTVESTQNKTNRFYVELPVFRFSNDRIEAYLLSF